MTSTMPLFYRYNLKSVDFAERKCFYTSYFKKINDFAEKKCFYTPDFNEIMNNDINLLWTLGHIRIQGNKK